MVKPALAFLDVISRARAKFNVPLAAYNVSGEYAMVKAAAQAGYLDEEKAVLEIMASISRAGAGVILTYHAKDIARWLKAERSLTQALSSALFYSPLPLLRGRG
jgi:porphobilinogen synthase